MSGPQLSIFTHENLRPYEVIESLNVNQIDLQGDVIFVCKTSKREIVVNSRKQITKTSKEKAQKTKIPTEGPDSRVPPLGVSALTRQ